jgi:16S rRNA (guanine(966)-N(2))-methyltransferase RsmD
MRIISGNSKGRKILTPKGFGVTRPALEKVREAVFSSLGDMSGKVVLDIFAGSGSLGLEALSRGANRAYFVEDHPQALSCLIANLKNLGFENQARVFKRKLPQGLSQIELSQKPDVIFCDPPYDKNLLNPTLNALVQNKLLGPHALVIVEHTKREMPENIELSVLKERQYGQTLITYLRLK